MKPSGLRLKRLAIFLSIVIHSTGFLFADDAKKPAITDKKLCHEIHSLIVSDKNLPYCAHIVRVHAKQGKVTLHGIVHTKQQKELVGDKAAQMAGNENVTNLVSIQHL